MTVASLPRLLLEYIDEKSAQAALATYANKFCVDYHLLEEWFATLEYQKIRGYNSTKSLIYLKVVDF